MKIFNNKLSAWALVCSILISFTSCLDETPNVPSSNLAYALLYHGSPNAPALTVKVDDTQLNTTGFAYAQVTSYLSFFPGSRTFEFGPFSSSTVSVDTTVTFKPNTAYSIFFADEIENAQVVILTDTSEATVDDKADFRVINLSPDAGTINFKVSGETDNLFDDLEFKDAVAFTRVDAGEYDFEVRSAGGDNLLLSIPNTQLNEKYFYTIVIRGYKTPPGGNTNILAAQIIRN